MSKLSKSIREKMARALVLHRFKEFGVGTYAIRDCVSGSTWGWLEDHQI